MNVDFFKLELPNGAPTTLQTTFESIAALPDDESRTAGIRDTTARLQFLEFRGGMWHGDSLRIRMNNLPLIASTGGATDVLSLNDDEGIGEETAFLYHPGLNVLAIQRNRFGLSTNLLLRLIESFAAFDRPIVPLPILKEDAIEQLMRVKTVRKFGVRLAGIQNPGLIVAPSDTEADAIQLLQDARAPVIEITMSMGYERGSLAVRAVRHAARMLHKFAVGSDAPTTDVEKITIEGRYDDDSRADFDLLEFRITETVDVQLDLARRLPYNGRRAGMIEAWDRRVEEIENIISRAVQNGRL